MNKKSAIVTGGSRGIGKGIALRLAKDGYNIVIANINENKQTINDIKSFGVKTKFIKCDISNNDDRVNLVDWCMKEFGRIDVLVNNAGVAPKKCIDILETTEESFDYVLDINLKGTFFLTQLVANEMIKKRQEIECKNPKIINISSISAYTSSVLRPEYCISKAGLSMITKLFADRLAQHNIYVYEIRPGIIATDMTSGVKDKYDKQIKDGLTPIKRWGCPEDVAKAVSALCNDMFLFSTGEVINVDGGFHIQKL